MEINNITFGTLNIIKASSFFTHFFSIKNNFSDSFQKLIMVNIRFFLIIHFFNLFQLFVVITFICKRILFKHKITVEKTFLNIV